MDFECHMCGGCCRGKGSVPIEDDKELEAVARACGMSPELFRATYRVEPGLPPGPRWLLPVHGRCPLLTSDDRCYVYAVRPDFCRRFPDALRPGEKAAVKCPFCQGGS